MNVLYFSSYDDFLRVTIGMYNSITLGTHMRSRNFNSKATHCKKRLSIIVIVPDLLVLLPQAIRNITLKGLLANKLM